jgi:SET domain/MYND finger
MSNDQASSASAVLLDERKRAIESCIQWADEFGRRRHKDDEYPHVMEMEKIEILSSNVAATTSFRPSMLGVFARENIKEGEVLWTIPEKCVLSESHPLLEDIASGCVDLAMKVYRDNVAEKWKTAQKQHNPWISFHKSKGRVFADNELRLGLHMTILIFVHRLRKNGSQSIGGTLGDATAHFGFYLDTLPQTFESLIFHWSDEELEFLYGTASHALSQLLQHEVQENWEQTFQDVLVPYLQRQLKQDEIDQTMLHQSYIHAICIIYSRMHALDVVANVTSKSNTSCTCPLVDLLNGDRDESPRCNTHLVHFPGIHVALQATRDIEAGHELAFSYGQVSNQVFISKFGFIPLNQAGYPTINELDVVHILPPPRLVWDESDPRWSSLTSERDGKALERRHVIDICAEEGTPFALMGDAGSIAKVRGSDTWKPPYLNNIHLYAMLSLTDPDEEENLVEPWEPGAIILDMIDFRLDQFPTKSMKEDKELLAQTQTGNRKTAILYRIVEREILTMWRHAIAKQHDVYGETNSNGNKYEPLLTEKDGCCVCQTALAGPLKSCTRCKAVHYCSKGCQKEDWKAGHKEACHLVE